MSVRENFKAKVLSNPRAVKAITKGLDFVSGATVAAVGVACSAASAFAEGGGSSAIFGSISADDAVSQVTANASPFMQPALILMTAVAGARLGWRFLRSAAH